MFPLFAVIALFAAVGLIRRSSPPAPPATRSAGTRLPLPRVGVGATTLGMPYHLQALLRLVRSGVRPPEYMVNEAVREAFEAGDLGTVRMLQDRFGPPDIDPLPDTDAQTEGGTVTVSGKSSPLDGVSNAEWEEFVSRLATEDPAHRTDRHVGTYHQSVERLRQLGLEPPTTPEAQYDALVADLVDLHAAAADLARDFVATTVTTDTGDHPVTLSGLLGLLKAAGPEGARSWLANPSDRTRFPRTTATFHDTNGVF